MKQISALGALLAIAALSITLAVAQNGGEATKHYEKYSLAFDYPAGWTLTESGTSALQVVTIATAGNETQIGLTVERTFNRSCDFPTEVKNIRTTLVGMVASQINAPSPVRTSVVQTQIDTIDTEGTQIKGVIDNKPVIADVYSLQIKNQFVSLIYIRNEGDESAQPAWEMVRRTTKLEKAVITYGAEPASGSKTRQPGSGPSGVLNGRAIELPRPSYPPVARAAHASGTVVVQVVIDETGKVISAKAVYGNPALQGVSVDAARAAKFEPPKLCGEPLRVTGVITYNFVAQ